MTERVREITKEYFEEINKFKVYLNRNGITFDEFHRCSIKNTGLSREEIVSKMIENRKIDKHTLAKIKTHKIGVQTYIRYKDMYGLNTDDTIALIKEKVVRKTREDHKAECLEQIGKQFKTINGHDIKIVEYDSKASVVVEFDDRYQVATNMTYIEKRYIFHYKWDVDEILLEKICNKAKLKYLRVYVDWVKAGKPDVIEFITKRKETIYLNSMGELIIL